MIVKAVLVEEAMHLLLLRSLSREGGCGFVPLPLPVMLAAREEVLAVRATDFTWVPIVGVALCVGVVRDMRELSPPAGAPMALPPESRSGFSGSVPRRSMAAPVGDTCDMPVAR